MNRQKPRQSLYLQSCLLLAGTLALSACAGQAPLGQANRLPQQLSPAPGAPAAPAQAGGAGGRTSGNVLLLVPLSGNMAPVGQALENAAKLAFPANAAPSLDVRDTGGTQAGAAAAAQAGIAAGDGVILGPLTAAETQAVAPIAKAANVNVLAFTNDGTLAAPGIWPLGITPAQQVQRVLQVAANAGRTQLAALLPDSDFGHHLAVAINGQTATLGEPPAQISFYEPGFSGVSQAVQSLSNYAARGGGNATGANGKKSSLSRQQIAPPSFNALFIGATDGNTLAELANFLPYYGVNPPQVQFLGPALWATLAPAMASQSVLLGAMYAAPDPAGAAAFSAKYQAAYGNAPPAIADVAFDAAAMARLASSSGGYTSAVFTAPAGFTGTDGVLALNPDGTVRRGLAVFSIAAGAPVITSPAPSSLTAPGN